CGFHSGPALFLLSPLPGRSPTFPYLVQPREIGCAGSKPCSSDQAEHVPGWEKSSRQELLFGSPDHCLRRLPLFFVHRMHAPKRIHAIADFRLTTESINTDLRTMLRNHARR